MIAFRRIKCYFIILLVLINVVFIPFLTTNGSWVLDRDQTLFEYPNIANDFGIWSLVAISGIIKNPLVFYYFASLFAMVLFSYYIFLQRRNLQTLEIFLITISFIFWFEFIQLRYGTAIIASAVSFYFLREKKYILSTIFMCLGIAIHKIAFYQIFISISYLTLNSRFHKFFKIFYLSLVILIIFNFNEVNNQLKIISNYDFYNSEFEYLKTNTFLKYLFIISIFSLFRKSICSDILFTYLLHAFVFLIFSFDTIFAGRSFQYYLYVLLSQKVGNKKVFLPISLLFFYEFIAALGLLLEN